MIESSGITTVGFQIPLICASSTYRYETFSLLCREVIIFNDYMETRGQNLEAAIGMDLLSALTRMVVPSTNLQSRGGHQL